MILEVPFSEFDLDSSTELTQIGSSIQSSIPREKLTCSLSVTLLSIRITELVDLTGRGGVNKVFDLLSVGDWNNNLSASSSTTPYTSSASQSTEESVIMESNFLSLNLRI